MSNNTITITAGTTVWASDDTARTAQVADVQEIKLEAGEFVIESFQGFRTIGRFTGRTRVFFGGVTCLTIQRFDVETVAIDGAIWGVRGEAIKGTWAVRKDRTI